MDYKYKVGQKVRVRPDLERHVKYYMRSGPRVDYVFITIGWSFEDRKKSWEKLSQFMDITPVENISLKRMAARPIGQMRCLFVQNHSYVTTYYEKGYKNV